MSHDIGSLTPQFCETEVVYCIASQSIASYCNVYCIASYCIECGGARDYVGHYHSI